MDLDVGKIKDLIESLEKEELESLDELIYSTLDSNLWVPLSGPQEKAYYSEADIIGYGGAAGGGKTDLACGLALTKHKKTAIFRRESTQLTGIVDRLTDILGSRDGYNGAEKIWRGLPNGKQIEFGSAPHAGDETKHQGRPKDLLVLDEAANFLESQVRFLMGWARTTEENQKVTVLMTFNPPTTAEGQWIIEFFAPWLDDKHPNPALAGELRYFTTIEGKDIEVSGPDEVVVDPKTGEQVKVLSRTFIPSRIRDNPFLVETGYTGVLQSLPEPLRSQMLYGDFKAGMEDDIWQVIPSQWVEEAQARWEPRKEKGFMDSMGVDVARGGRDNTVIARRHGMWFDEPVLFKGSATPNGPAVAGQVISNRRSDCPVHVDIIGVGSSVYDFLDDGGTHAVAVVSSGRATEPDQTHKLKFFNYRTQIWWKMREALDPKNDTGIALPPSSKLKAELCTPLWSYHAGGVVKVELKEDTIKRLGRSPDMADAYIYANIITPHRRKKEEEGPHFVTHH